MPALAPDTIDTDPTTTGVMVAVCPVKSGDAQLYANGTLQAGAIGGYCGGSLAVAVMPYGDSRVIYAMRDVDAISERAYFDLGGDGDAGPGLIADPFVGEMGIAANASGPVVVGLNKAGQVIAQIPAPNGGWGLSWWRGWPDEPAPVFVTVGSHGKYGAAATTTFTEP
jgi:hypothetical protein